MDETSASPTAPKVSEIDGLKVWANAANEALEDLDARITKGDRLHLIMAGGIAVLGIASLGQAMIASRLIKAVGAIAETVQGLARIPNDAVQQVQTMEDKAAAHPPKAPTTLGPIDETILPDEVVGPIDEPRDTGPVELSPKVAKEVAADRTVVQAVRQEPEVQ